MSDVPPRGIRPLVILGGAALLLAVATETLSVVGRHVGYPLLGAVELVQAAILVAACAAIIIATVERRHAVVNLVLNRLTATRRDTMERLGFALATLLVGAWLAGAVWIAVDMAPGQEESELLRIPYIPLRLIEIAALLAVTILFAVQAIGRRR